MANSTQTETPRKVTTPEEAADLFRKREYCGYGEWIVNGDAVMAMDGGFVARCYALNHAVIIANDYNGYYSTLEAENQRLTRLIDTPHTDDFLKAIPLEAAHQIKRWGSRQDDGKTPLDWFWLVGYLSQKAVVAAQNGDIEKAKHHTISTSACLLNWYRRLTGDDTTLRPGIETPQGELAEVSG